MVRCPEPPAPIDQQAVAVDAQHAALDLIGAAGRQAGGGGGRGAPGGRALSNVLDRLLVGAANDYVNVTPTFTFNLAAMVLMAA